MNPIITDQRPPPLQPPRPSVTCHRHPHDNNFTGFCPSCLCERLTILDQSATATTTAASSSSRRNSTATAAVKSTFRVTSSSNATSEASRKKLTSETSSVLELRRTKSFSASKNEELGFFAGGFEPQRKSCDVRGRNTLWSLFSIDDDNKSGHSTQQQTSTVLETNKEEEEEYEEDKDRDDDVIRVSEEQEVRKLDDLENDIVAMEAEIDAIVDNLKSMKDHIDLDSHSKKPSLSNFWSAASVLSKKWQKWRRKQKKSVDSSRTLPVEKPISRRRRETLSEIADYGFGRRSCDIDPRFSLDAGRISFDDPRYSFDEPRASWDGYLIGRSFPRLPPMVEDVAVVHPPRSDMQIPVEEPTNSDNIPGGSTQTREYYLDSSSNSKRRKSLDRSNSIREMAAAMVGEMDERKTTTAVSNAKVSPATVDWNHIHGRPKFQSIGGENELQRDSFSNSLGDDGSESFDFRFRDSVNKEAAKKSRWWSRKLWGFINGQSANRGGEQPWQDPRRDRNGELGGGFNQKLYRSSSVSWRSSSHMKNSNSVENGKNRREGDEFVFERNRSARYSPNNGLLRFYLTPLRGSRRTGTAKSRLSSNSHSIARNMFRLY